MVRTVVTCRRVRVKEDRCKRWRAWACPVACSKDLAKDFLLAALLDGLEARKLWSWKEDAVNWGWNNIAGGWWAIHRAVRARSRKSWCSWEVSVALSVQWHQTVLFLLHKDRRLVVLGTWRSSWCKHWMSKVCWWMLILDWDSCGLWALIHWLWVVVAHHVLWA